LAYFLSSDTARRPSLEAAHPGRAPRLWIAPALPRTLS